MCVKTQFAHLHALKPKFVLTLCEFKPKFARTLRANKDLQKSSSIWWDVPKLHRDKVTWRSPVCLWWDRRLPAVVRRGRLPGNDHCHHLSLYPTPDPAWRVLCRERLGRPCWLVCLGPRLAPGGKSGTWPTFKPGLRSHSSKWITIVSETRRHWPFSTRMLNK